MSIILKPPTKPSGLCYDAEQSALTADFGSQVLRYHRYLALLSVVRGKDVLDIASGEGFGSWLLSQSARRVIGVDVSADAVTLAGGRYQRENLEYRKGDWHAIPLDEASVDVVTSYDALEHIIEHETFLKEIRRVLRPGGILVMSIPLTVSCNASLGAKNACQLEEFTREDFRNLLLSHFAHVAIYDQGVTLASLIWPEQEPGSEMCVQPWPQECKDEASGRACVPNCLIMIASTADAELDGIGGVFYAFPDNLPISAIEGGTVDRMEATFGARKADPETERRALLDEVRNLKIQVQHQRQMLSEQTVSRMQPVMRRWKRKRRFYATVAKIDVVAGARFGERMRRKRLKYDALLDAANPRNLKPEMLSSYDRILLNNGNPSATSPDQGGEPVASIVIPAYNQIDYTLACLRSLARHETELTFEVIVVDDCSSDTTEEQLQNIPWIRYIRQPKNGGFIESCNTGVAAARGRYVVFLNNDTEPMAGWLDELIGTFAIFPYAGLVGSKLLYPDGSLQEAGGIIWRDGSALNYGRNEDPNRPEYCYARRVDYCSGASIAVPRDLLKTLGSFDRHFSPAYYEDTDLAMRISQIGRDVIFQPLSKVVHYEGITSGTDTGSGVKAFQVTNAKKFHARWKETLAHRPKSGSDLSSAKDFGVKKRLLVIDADTPRPDQDAGSVATLEMIKVAQALGYQVTFIPESNLAEIPKYTAVLQRMGVEAVYAPYCPSVRDHLAQFGRRYDAIMAFRVGTLWRYFDEIRRYAPKGRIVYQVADLQHLREARQAELTGDTELAAHAEKIRRRELELARRCDCTIVHSSYEKAYLADQVPGAVVELFSWIFDPVASDADFASRSGMLFLGGYRHQPNVDAVNWFLDEIWPIVQPRLPGAQFYVVGSDLPEQLARRCSASVKMVGYVEDVKPIMDRCRLSVVPLRFGAGSKGKLAMSLAHGLPVVATSIGAEGMGLTDGEEVFIADEPATLADRIVELHEDPETWEQMSRAASDYVRNNFSRRRGTEAIRRALEPPAHHNGTNI